MSGRICASGLFACALLLASACNRPLARDDQWLGFEVEPLTETSNKSNRPASMWSSRGVRVTGVGGAAAAAGVLPGDVVSRVNGRPVADVPSFEQAILTVPAGFGTKLEVARGNAMLSLLLPARSPGPAADGARETPAGAARPSPNGRPAAPPSWPGMGAFFPGDGLRGEPVQIPQLGIEVGELRTGAVVVHRIYRRSWGERGGLAPGDQLVSVGGQPVGNLAGLARLVGQARAESPTALGVLRGGRPLTLQVMVGEGELETTTVPADAALSYAKQRAQQAAGPGSMAAAHPVALIGGVKPKMVKKLGMEVVPAHDGVEVSGVMVNSHADLGGLRAGDVIVRVGRERVKTLRRFDRTITAAAPGALLPLAILRAGTARTLTVKIGEGEMEGASPIVRP